MSTNPHKFNIAIRTEEYDTETESTGLACQLVFTYTEKYPDTAPLVEIEDPINFEDDYEETLLVHVKETVCIPNLSAWMCDMFLMLVLTHLMVLFYSIICR